MGEIIVRKVKVMNWKTKISLVLIFTLVFSTFMYQGWYKPKEAKAAVGEPSAWANVKSTAPALVSGNVTSSSFTPASGSNRLLVAGVCMEVATGNATVTTMNVRLDNATGTAFTLINTTGGTAQRAHCYMGYLKESQITAGAHSIYVGYAISANTVAGLHVDVATFDGVDQTTPVNSSGQNKSAATSVTFGASAINYVLNGMTTYISTNGGTPATQSTPATPAFTQDVITTTSAFTTAAATTAVHTGASNYASPTTVTWAGTTSARSALVVASLNPVSGNLTVGDPTNPADANAPRSSTNNALDGFTMAMSGGTATVSTLTFTGSANFTTANVSSVKVYHDNGTLGTFDGADTLIPTSFSAITGNATTITFTTPEAIDTTTQNYLIVVDITAGATLAQTFTGRVTAATGTGLGTPTYSDTTSATLTITVAQTLTIGNGTNPASANAPRSSTDNDLDAFTLSLNSGSGTVSTLTVTGSANFNATNIPTNGVKVYRDAGTIGVLDGADTLISSGSTAIAGNATTVTLASAETVTTTAANYLVTVDINAGATLAQAFTGTISAAAGSGLGTPVDNDTTSATLTITAAQLTVGNGTNPADANAPRSSTNNALDGFTMAMSGGTATVSTLTFTGSANFTTANVSSVKVYHDNGTLGTFDGADTLIPTSFSAITGNATTITFTTPEAIDTTTQNYLIVVDITAGATLAQTFTGRVTAATGTGLGTPTYSDTTSATLTITVAQTLTIGNGTNPASANAPQSATNNALDAFTLSLNSGSGTVLTLTVTGSANFNATNIPTNGVKIYRDAGTIGTYDSGVDTLISSGSTAIAGNATTVTLASAETVTTTAANYLVTVDINAGATLAQAFTGTISAATGSGLGTPVDNDTTSATLTITVAKLPSTITSCGGCHTYPPTDGSARNNPAGSVVGSHSKHGDNCSYCHVAPATTTSADFKHRNELINMISPIYNTGGVYNATNSPNIPHTNNKTGANALSNCTNVACHVNATTPTPTWGTAFAVTITCDTCHRNQLTASGPAQDKRRRITNTTSDFSKALTHAKPSTANIPVDSTCQICHWNDHYWFGGDPKAGLKNPDSPMTRVDYDGTGGSIETFCNNCHDSNGANGNTDPFGVDGAAPANINWTVGTVAHSQNSGSGAGSIAQDKCMACHGDAAGTAGNTLTPKVNAHGSSQAKLMRYTYVSTTNVTTATNVCYNCHGNTAANGAVDEIKDQFDLTGGRHSTVTCLVCHNPHQAEPGNHTAGSATIANVLLGVAGVNPTNSATNWGGATALTVVTSSDAEYKICFKCHAATGTTVDITLGGVAPGASTSFTNLGLEFNPNNESYHPVVQALPSTGNRRLASGALTGGWTPGGVMTCSDCHSTDVSGKYGPHGSSVKWMLNPNTTGTKYYNWPYTTAAMNGSNSATSGDFVHGTGTSTVPPNNFCFSCHTWSGGGAAHTGCNSHNMACVGCHIRVPHGGKMPRLLTSTNVPARYRPSGQAGGYATYLGGVDRPASGTIGMGACWAAGGCTASEHPSPATYSW